MGGNSKVLMFVNISPAIYNLSETLCSLTFATRCRNVELGQAKKQISSGNNSTGSNNGDVVERTNTPPVPASTTTSQTTNRIARPPLTALSRK